VSPRLCIRQQPIELPVAGDVKAGYYEIGMLYRCNLRRAVGREQMLGVNDARLQLGIKGTAVEGVEKTLVGTSVGRAVVGCKGWLRPERPPAASRVDEAHVRVRNQAGDRVTSALELAAELCDLAIHPPGQAAVGKNTAPVGLSPKVQGVPVPVFDHLGAAGYESPRCLPPLAVVGRAVEPRATDGLSIRLCDEEWRLLGRIHPVGAQVQRPRTGRDPILLPLSSVGQLEAALHHVVGVAGSDIEDRGQR